ncbi:MAG: V-type ATP synthase subunit D [Gemmatimonadales bacterium]|nr:V-type ATP synthase subunit D [Gemmatimonadales bacterium]
MSASRGPPPTRSQLLRLRRRLDRVRKGVDLLTRKRQALVRELFRVATPAIAARQQVEAEAAEAWPALLAALAAEGGDALERLGWPRRQLEVQLSATESWGVRAVAVERISAVRRSLAGRAQAPGLTGAEAAVASERFEALLEQLLDAATAELRLRRLAEALGRTSRQVNTLERRVAPALVASEARIRAVLEEREREDAIRLRRLLDRRG